MTKPLKSHSIPHVELHSFFRLQPNLILVAERRKESGDYYLVPDYRENSLGREEHQRVGFRLGKELGMNSELTLNPRWVVCSSYLNQNREQLRMKRVDRGLALQLA